MPHYFDDLLIEAEENDIAFGSMGKTQFIRFVLFWVNEHNESPL